VITIRNAQLAAFDEAALQRSIGGISAHVRKHFTALLAGVPQERLDRALRRIVAEAGSRGLQRTDEVLLFVNLSMVFGEGFTQRTELTWMQQILNDPALRSPRERIRRVHAEAVRRGS
jgi:FAD/FMN-containing dehydrogenase